MEVTEALVEVVPEVSSNESSDDNKQNHAFNLITEKFYKNNVLNKRFYSSENSLKTYVKNESFLEMVHSSGIRPNRKSEYIPFYAVGLKLDGAVPFEIFGKENVERYKAFKKYTIKELAISDVAYKFISMCVDMGKFNILFLISEQDLYVTSNTSLKEALVRRFNALVNEQQPDYCHFHSRECMSFAGAGTSMLSAFAQSTKMDYIKNINAFNMANGELCNLFYLYSGGRIKFSMLIKREHLSIVRALLFSGKSVPSNMLAFMIVDRTYFQEEQDFGLLEHIQENKIEIVYTNMASFQTKLMEDKKLPSFSSVEQKTEWKKKFIKEFVISEMGSLGIPYTPKLQLEDGQIL